MGRKVFQISFILLVLAAFGTVFNHYLKNKVSDPANYVSYIENFPQSGISIIDPITITIPRDFDKQEYQLNTPLNSAIVQFDPSVKGTLYWSNTKTLEFYPDEPLQSNTEYMVKVDVNRIYKLNTKVKIFRFRLNTFKQVLYISAKGFEAEDSTLVNQRFEGSIVFNDFIDIDNVYQIFSASQTGKKLNISFTPGKTRASYYFSISGVIRLPDVDSLLLSWDASEIGLELKGSQNFIIPPLNSFQVENIELLYNGKAKVEIKFSDELKKNQPFDSLISIKGAMVDEYLVKGKTLFVYLADSVIEKAYISINSSIKNTIGMELSNDFTTIIDLNKNEPALRIIDSTFIYSELSENFHWEFEALKLKSVDVQIYKVFANNVLQFLQTNSMQGINQLERVGSIVFENTVSLEDQLQYNPDNWERYQLNINDFIPEEGCVYNVLVGFRKEQTTLKCNESEIRNRVDWSTFRDSYYDSIKTDSASLPCSSSFYGFRKSIHHNLYYAKLGILAKTIGEDSLYIWVNNLQNGEPVKNASIEVLNFQQQIIAKATSDIDGMSHYKLNDKPSFIIARQGQFTTYLKLDKSFNSKLKNIQGDLNFKGYFMFSRSYWSPGDSINIGFVHNIKYGFDRSSTIELSIYSPDKKKVHSEIQSINANNLYNYKYFVPQGSLKGEYTAEISVGGKEFIKKINVWPPVSNQLNPKITYLEKVDGAYVYELQVADFLKQSGNIEYFIDVKSMYPEISDKKFSNYNFIIEQVENKHHHIEGYLSDSNKVIFEIPEPHIYNASKVIHKMQVRVIHESVGFNQIDFINTINLEQPLIGISLNEKPKYYCDSTYTLKLKLLDKLHRKVKGRKNLNVVVSKINSAGVSKRISKKEVNVLNGNAKYVFFVPFPEKGKYVISFSSNNEEYYSQQKLDIDWPEFYSAKAIAKIEKVHASIKNVYPITNDSLMIELVSSISAKMLLTIENPYGLCYSSWNNIKQGNEKIVIPLNIKNYKHLVINGYVISNKVKPQFCSYDFYYERELYDLKPMIFGPHETEAEKEFTFKVKEEHGLAMRYMIAIHPLNQNNIDTTFNAQQYFDASFLNKNGFADIFGNRFSNKMDDYYIGYDYDNAFVSHSPFNPFDFLLGPFAIEENEGRNHKLILPQFIGDVVISILSNNVSNNLYGTAYHQLRVNKPFMILTSSPKQIAPSETFFLPVNVYSSKNDLRKTKLTLTSNSELNILDSISKNVWVNYLKPDTTEFKLSSKQRTGMGEIDIVASDSSFKTSAQVQIPIISNGLYTINTQINNLAPQQKWQTRFTPIGVKGTNVAAIEYSTRKNIHISQLIQKLLNNRHPDIEHLVSSALPLLFVSSLTNVGENLQNQINKHISNVLNQLIYYQLPSGGFSYWASGESENAWSSTYAGYFMLRAQEKGFQINQAVFNKWLRYQRRKCLTYNYEELDDVVQTFGLYALSLTGKSDMRSMNRMMDKEISIVADWFLKMADQEMNKNKASGVGSLLLHKNEYLNDPTFGNELRDKAIQLSAFIYNEKEVVNKLIDEVAVLLQDPNNHSLQAIAFALVSITDALGQVEKHNNKSINYTLNRGKDKIHESNKPYAIVNIPLEFTLTKSIDIINNCNHTLNICIDNAGRPYNYNEKAKNNTVRAFVKYLDSENHFVKNAGLKKNDQIKANIEIQSINNKLDLQNMVLVYPIANCFSLLSNSFLKQENIKQVHQDDQNVYVYFTLPKQGLKFSIPLLATYQGEFLQAPIQVYNLYNQQIKTVVKGGKFNVN